MTAATTTTPTGLRGTVGLAEELAQVRGTGVRLPLTTAQLRQALAGADAWGLPLAEYCIRRVTEELPPVPRRHAPAPPPPDATVYPAPHEFDPAGRAIALLYAGEISANGYPKERVLVVGGKHDTEDTVRSRAETLLRSRVRGRLRTPALDALLTEELAHLAVKRTPDVLRDHQPALERYYRGTLKRGTLQRHR